MCPRVSRMVLTIFTATLLAGYSTLALAKDDKYRARQHGYEHGYRDGYHQGRETRESQAKYNLETKDYKEGDRGYDKHMGDGDEYKQGYRTGYQGGYDDAFYSRPGRFAEIYGREDTHDKRRDRDVTIIEVPRGGYSDIAFDNGYRDGIRAGQRDLATTRNLIRHLSRAIGMGIMVTEAASAIWKCTSDNTAKVSCAAIKMVTAVGSNDTNH